jgi:membrane-bound ClpP family serine protease
MWPLICLIVGLVLLISEIFVPSGGVLGILAAGLLGLSLWLSFAHSTALGAKFLGALAVLVPVVAVVGVQLWPHTPVGRRMILRPPTEDDYEPAVPGAAGGTRLEHVVGQFGRSVTTLRPSGVVEVAGRRFDALSEDGMIGPGEAVRAIEARGNQLVVRAAKGDPLFEDLVGGDRLA